MADYIGSELEHQLRTKLRYVCFENCYIYVINYFAIQYSIPDKEMKLLSEQAKLVMKSSDNKVNSWNYI